MRSLEREAPKIVALQERDSVINSAGEISWVDAGEGVDCPGVTADLHDIWVFRHEDRDVCNCGDCTIGV